MEADQAPVVLARWVYYGSVIILFGSSLFPLYALVGRDPAPALLPRAVNVTLALAALVAASGWLLGFTAMLAGPEDWADTLRAVLLQSDLGTVWIVRLLGAALLVGATLLHHTLVAAPSLVLLACEGWSGHAAAWETVGSLTMAAHLVGAGAWIGGLVPLARISHTFCDPGAIWGEKITHCKSLTAAGQADPFRQSVFQPSAGRLIGTG
jgi:copper resistance protein D